MVAQVEYDLMANRSDRRLPTLLSVRAHYHEADGMIRDPGARISIKARAASKPPITQAGYMTATASPSMFLTPCTRAGSIYDRRGLAQSFLKDAGRSVCGIDWENGIFGRCVTAWGRTGQLRYGGKRFALQFGLELAFVDRLVLVRC